MIRLLGTLLRWLLWLPPRRKRRKALTPLVGKKAGVLMHLADTTFSAGRSDWR